VADMLYRKHVESESRKCWAPLAFLILILLFILHLHLHRLLLIIETFPWIADDIYVARPGRGRGT